VPVLGFETTDAGIAVRLGTDADRAALVTDSGTLTELPVRDGTLLLADLPALAPGATATVRVGDADVVRSRNAMNRPMAAVALPALPDSEVALRWTPNARLALRREEAS
jgi:hypothetical protein